MADNLLTRAGNAWNAFFDKYTPFSSQLLELVKGGVQWGNRPSRARLSVNNGRSIISSIYTRITVDAASAKINHVRVDENERYLETIHSGLNECVSFSSNIDQISSAFMQDAVQTMIDDGVIAIVAVDTTRDPRDSEAYDVNSLRVGKVKQWYARAVRVDVYNDRTGQHEEITLPKWSVAIVENPFYNIMNDQNSTLKRLVSKLNLLDAIDQQSGSGKLDLILQLPYVIKSESRKRQAEERRKDITDQLKDSQYGIAYTDGTEKVVQLNRPTENNLMKQVEFLTTMLFDQLFLTPAILNGTADEATMINYYKRTIEPIVDAIVNSMARTFISKTARTQGQRLMAFNDPFKLVPMSTLADIADKFTRAQALTGNDVRGIIGMKPLDDPVADQLTNANMGSDPSQQVQDPTQVPEGV